MAITLTLAFASLTVRFLSANHLDQTAALYVGLPVVLTIMLSLTPRAKSASGMAMK